MDGEEQTDAFTFPSSPLIKRIVPSPGKALDMPLSIHLARLEMRTAEASMSVLNPSLSTSSPDKPKTAYAAYRPQTTPNQCRGPLRDPPADVKLPGPQSTQSTQRSSELPPSQTGHPALRQRPSLQFASSTLASASMGAATQAEHAEKLIILELRDRVRELSNQMQLEQEHHIRERAENKTTVKKLESERDKLRFQRTKARIQVNSINADFKKQEESNGNLKKEVDCGRQRVMDLERTLTRNWHTVGIKDQMIQRLKRDVQELKDELEKDLRARTKAWEAKHAADRVVEPLRSKNLELEYRLQTQSEWRTTMLTQLTALEGELAAERAYTEHMQKVFRKVYKERQDFQEEGAHKQLLVQDLHEDNTELHGRFEALQSERAHLKDILHQMMRELQLAGEAREELTGEVEALSTWAEAIGHELEHKESEATVLATDLHQTKGALKKRDKERESMETELDKMRLKLGDINKKKEDQKVSGVKNVKYTKKPPCESFHGRYATETRCIR